MSLLDAVNDDLKKYVTSEIFPKYQLNSESHGIEHIKQVIKRSFEILEEYENTENNEQLNYDVLYVAAAYHDLGDHIDRKLHHIISGKNDV